MDSQVDTDQQIKQPSSPVSSGLKEQEPVPTSVSANEYLTPSETGPELPEEVRDTGVSESFDDSKISGQATGIQHSGPFVEPKIASEGVIKLPITEEEMKQVEKEKTPSDSIRWWVKLLRKFLRKNKGGRV